MIEIQLEAAHEVDSKKSKGKIRRRKNLPPNSAEANVYNRLYSKTSYDNYGNKNPYGTGSNAVSNTVPSGSNTVSSSGSSE